MRKVVRERGGWTNMSCCISQILNLFGLSSLKTFNIQFITIPCGGGLPSTLMTTMMWFQVYMGHDKSGTDVRAQLLPSFYFIVWLTIIDVVCVRELRGGRLNVNTFDDLTILFLLLTCLIRNYQFISFLTHYLQMQ